MADKIAGFGKRDEWGRSITFLEIDAQAKLKTQKPKLDKAKQEVAESLVRVIETEKAKPTRWQVKYNRIVKSDEVTQYVFTFYPHKMHVVHQ